MHFQVKVTVCDQNGHPLYWNWATRTAQPGDRVCVEMPDPGKTLLEWIAIPVSPAAATRMDQEKLDPILGAAYRRFGAEGGDLVMAAWRLGRGESL